MEEETSIPTDFKRMLSWQLSQVRDVPVSTSRRKQRKRKAREVGVASPPGCGLRHPCSDDDEEEEEEEGRGGFAYLVVNSEDEEEWYYSAPESPLESGDELGTYGTQVGAGTFLQEILFRISFTFFKSAPLFPVIQYAHTV